LLSVLPGGNKYYQELQETRDKLKKELRVVVEIFGPKLGSEFWGNRIVSLDDIAKDDGSPALNYRKHK